MAGLKWPTWEASKEIAGKLPGGQGDDEGDGEVCEECGRPLEDDNVKPGKLHGKF
jgi:hypothetical protein